ncbi:MAG: MBL fold metallo-hydrolase [Thermoleophilia bacterium]|nr:MBL fold metallo-hydrolase [Thermoleophilia bacterium]
MLEPLSERVYRFDEACNVYVLTAGRAAIVIDVGTGAILDELAAVGIAPDWVLLTHQHRDQCAGASAVARTEARLAVPTRFAHWVAHADALWQQQRVFDLYDCSNVFDRPLADVRVDRTLADYALFAWNDLELLVFPTPGHTKGSVTYLAEVDGVRWAFSGDLVHEGGRVWRVHDLQWDYSDPDGLDAALHSVQQLRARRPDRIAPSHGGVIEDPEATLETLERRLRRLLHVTGGRFVGDLEPRLAADFAVERVSEHLLSVVQTSANFHVLLGSEGRALFFDYGFPGFLGHVASGECRFVEHSLGELEREYGVRSVDVVVATHYHDDHVAGFHHLRDRFGTAVWAFDPVADVLERPAAYRLPATWSEPIAVDRRIGPNEMVEWDAFSFVARHLPGHTWYAAGLFGKVDGRRVAVTGDEIQLDGRRALRGGGPVFRNRFRPGSFRAGIDTVRDFQPDVLLTGHDGPIPVDDAAFDGLCAWADDLEAALADLVPPGVPTGLSLDPGFALFRPYQVQARPGRAFLVEVVVVNHADRPTEATVRLVLPPGWASDRETATEPVEPGGERALAFSIRAADDAAPGRRHVLAADVDLGAARFVQACEGIVTLEA